MLCVKFDWNWPSGSGEEDEKVYDNNDDDDRQQTNFDQKSSGELKKILIPTKHGWTKENNIIFPALDFLRWNLLSDNDTYCGNFWLLFTRLFSPSVTFHIFHLQTIFPSL